SFDATVRAYRDGRAPLGATLEALASAAGSSTPAVDGFLKALRLERALDSAAVERERAALLSSLGRRIDAAGARDLLADTVALKTGRLDADAYHRRLVATLDKAGVSLEKSPAFRAYLDYLAAADAVDATNLFADLSSLESA